jgi:hypothetical protein
MGLVEFSFLLPLVALFPSSYFLYKILSDVEISDYDSLANNITINIDPEVATDYSRGPDYVVHKGKTY